MGIVFLMGEGYAHKRMLWVVEKDREMKEMKQKGGWVVEMKEGCVLI